MEILFNMNPLVGIGVDYTPASDLFRNYVFRLGIYNIKVNRSNFNVNGTKWTSISFLRYRVATFKEFDKFDWHAANVGSGYFTIDTYGNF